MQIEPPGLVDEDRLAEALEPYATEAFVNDAIADFATENFVEDAVRGLASEEYVDEGDAATLATANQYTDESVAGLASETFVIESIDAAGVAITAAYTQAIGTKHRSRERLRPRQRTCKTGKPYQPDRIGFT